MLYRIDISYSYLVHTVLHLLNSNIPLVGY
jgi:hypothetical protein